MWDRGNGGGGGGGSGFGQFSFWTSYMYVTSHVNLSNLPFSFNLPKTYSSMVVSHFQTGTAPKSH